MSTKTVRLELTSNNPNTDDFEIFAVSGSTEVQLISGSTATGSIVVTSSAAPDFYWDSSVLQGGVDFEVFVSASSIKLVSNTAPCIGESRSVALLDDCRLYVQYNVFNESNIRTTLGLDINQQTTDFCSDIYNLLTGSFGDTPDFRLYIIAYNALLDNDLPNAVSLLNDFNCDSNNVYRINSQIPDLPIYTGDVVPNSSILNPPCDGPGGGTGTTLTSFNSEERWFGLSANFGQVVIFNAPNLQGTGDNFYSFNANLCPELTP